MVSFYKVFFDKEHSKLPPGKYLWQRLFKTPQALIFFWPPPPFQNLGLELVPPTERGGWYCVLQLGQQDVNLSINPFLDNMISILDEHVPLKSVNKYKLKFKSKPWITPAIQISVSVKNKLLKRFINWKDPQTKVFHKQY